MMHAETCVVKSLPVPESRGLLSRTLGAFWVNTLVFETRVQEGEEETPQQEGNLVRTPCSIRGRAGLGAGG